MKPAGRDHAWTWIGAAALVAVVAILVAVILAVGGRQPGRVQAVAFASGICLAGGLGGWLTGRLRPAEPALAVGAGLAAVSLRFFPALLAVVWLQAGGGGLADHGAAEWLLVFYLAVLATDILLHIMGARRGGRAGTDN